MADIFTTPKPEEVGASEKPKPGRLGTTTWKAFQRKKKGDEGI
jgi:hypothetical protein